MGKTKTILNTIITLVSLAIAPVFSIQYIKNMGITIPYFEPNTVIILGVVVAVFTLIDGLMKGGSGAVMTLIKYLASAYYSYRVMNMFTWFILSTPQAYGELIIEWGLWLYLVIGLTIVTGILQALSKIAEKEKEEEEEETEEK